MGRCSHLPSRIDLAYLLASRAPRNAREVDMYTQLGLYIDGEWLNGDGRAGEDVINPANEKVLARLPPVGVVTAFTPWNFPTLTPARKIGAALAAGCSIIIKVSEETPGSCIELVRCFIDAGVPRGVLNLVFGVPAQVSEHLLRKDAVRK